jgi:transposase
LRLRGVVAPKAYDRAMNAETFEAWLHHLLPTLEEGDIVVLDNLKAHKSPRVAEILVRKNCTVRYLPPYSPDFNPIEMAISKLKSVLRKLAERAVAGLIAILEGVGALATDGRRKVRMASAPSTCLRGRGHFHARPASLT